jgi:thiamine biosynthesis lipoprotein
LLGTFVEIAVAGAPRPILHAAVETAFGAVAEVHALMSFHDRRSDVSRLNGEAGTRAVRVHAWTFAVLEAALEFNRRSKGAFDIAVAPVLQRMRILPRPRTARAAKGGRDATTADIELLPCDRVRFQQPDVRIDLGGIAKGFAVDRAIDVLRGLGIEHGVVNAGGDLAAFGDPEMVHLRHPRDPARLLGCVAIRNQALASSGRRFDPFRSARTTGCAIVDPRTRQPIGAIDAVTVCAPICMVADALTKVVMVAGTSMAGLLDHYRASALVVTAHESIRITPDRKSAARRAA